MEPIPQPRASRACIMWNQAVMARYEFSSMPQRRVHDRSSEGKVTPPEPTSTEQTQEAKAEPTEAQVKEATDYVISKGYSFAAASKVIAEYGVERILTDKNSAVASVQLAAEEAKESGPLPPGRVTIACLTTTPESLWSSTACAMPARRLMSTSRQNKERRR